MRLPADVRLPDDVKFVTVRALGKERIIAPLNSSWDSFFLTRLCVTDDFMASHARQMHTQTQTQTQTQTERECFD